MASLTELGSVVGEAHARDAAPADAVDGVQPRWVAAPGSTEELAALMAAARAGGLRVAPTGGRSKVGWGTAPRELDLVVSTARLDRVVEHSAGDLVVSVQAGVPLEALRAALAPAGQMLALDPPEPRATVGGVIAANASGPLRLRYGTVRDLLIGVTVVLPDGTVARAGGKVVKNVAGYDLGRVMAGSLGTLAVVAEATFRLHPVPAARRLVTVALRAATDAARAVSALLRSTLVPTAIELRWGTRERTLAVRFDGIEPGVVAQAAAASELLRPMGEPSVIEEAAVDARWSGLAARPWGRGGLGLKVAYLPAELAAVLDALEGAAAIAGSEAEVAGSAGSGVLYVGAPAEDALAARSLVERLRAVRGVGSVVVQDAPPEVKAGLDVWGPVGSALPLMRRVKQQFDPDGILNPGRYVGGI